MREMDVERDARCFTREESGHDPGQRLGLGLGEGLE